MPTSLPHRLRAPDLEVVEAAEVGDAGVNTAELRRPQRIPSASDLCGLLISRGVKSVPPENRCQRALPHRLLPPDLEVVEAAVFAQAAKFHLGLRRVGDAGGLEEDFLNTNVSE